MKDNKKALIKTAGIVAATAGTAYLLIGNIFYYITLTVFSFELSTYSSIFFNAPSKDVPL
jgi:hypothetical protein